MKTQQPSVEGENGGKNASTVGPPSKPRKGTYEHLGRPLHRLGIANVMPTVADGKKPAVSGFWGRERRPVTDLDVEEFERRRGDRGVCWSPHPGEFYVNDVDQHGIRFDGDSEKHGAENLAAALGISVEELAQRLDGHLLVRTWAVPNDAPLADRLAGHWYFDGFEVPEGKRLARHIASGNDTIDHRFETVAPWSIRPDTFTLNGEPIEAARYLPFVFHFDAETGSATFEPVRNPGEFLAALRASIAPKWLRERWVEVKPERPQGGGDWSEAKPFAVEPDGEPDDAVKAVLDEYLADYGNYREAGSHHDSARKVQLDLAHLAEEGHAGVWTALSAAEGRYDHYRPGDWDSLLYGVTLDLDRMKRGAKTGDYGWVPALSTFPAYRPGSASGVEATTAVAEPYSTSIAGNKVYDFMAEYVARRHTDQDGHVTLRYFGTDRWGEFRADHGHYVSLTPEDVHRRLNHDLRGAKERVYSKKKAKDDEGEWSEDVRDVPRSPRVLAPAVKALGIEVLATEGSGTALRPLRGVVPFRNVLLHTQDRCTSPITPEWSVWWNVPVDYDDGALDAAEIRRWLAFLESIGWGPGTEEYRLLRQWMGYLIAGRKDQHKALCLIGPSRSGKGTILKVCMALVGDGAVGLRSLNQLGTEFGLQALLNKSLAVIDDARFKGVSGGVVETLLTIIADGETNVNVKHKDPVSVRLDARLMLATNESPRFTETSNALAERFLYLSTKESFLGKEDFGLEAALRGELSGIAKWALGGLDDLDEMGRFVDTEATRSTREKVLLDSSVVRRFVSECCSVDPDADAEAYVATDRLYRSYVMWAQDAAHNERVLDKNVFVNDLHVAFPRVETKRRGGRGARVQVQVGIRLNKGM